MNIVAGVALVVVGETLNRWGNLMVGGSKAASGAAKKASSEANAAVGVGVSVIGGLFAVILKGSAGLMEGGGAALITRELMAGYNYPRAAAAAAGVMAAGRCWYGLAKT